MKISSVAAAALLVLAPSVRARYLWVQIDTETQGFETGDCLQANGNYMNNDRTTNFTMETCDWDNPAQVFLYDEDSRAFLISSPKGMALDGDISVGHPISSQFYGGAFQKWNKITVHQTWQFCNDDGYCLSTNANGDVSLISQTDIADAEDVVYMWGWKIYGDVQCADKYDGDCSAAFVEARCDEILVKTLCENFCHNCPAQVKDPGPPPGAKDASLADTMFPPDGPSPLEDEDNLPWGEPEDGEVIVVVGTYENGVLTPGTSEAAAPPPDDGAPRPDAITGGSSGDPHFKTWNGTIFDFHGECDLLLWHAPSFAGGLGLTIQIRTKIESWWSFIDRAVIKIGQDIMEVNGGLDGGSYMVNGRPGQPLTTGDDFMLNDLKVEFRKVTFKQNKFRIDLGFGNSVGFETYKDWVKVDTHIKKPDGFNDSVGLMGQFPSGALMGRDGVTPFENMNAFGMEWQVLSSEPSLFSSTEGAVQHPTKCIMPDLVAGSELKRRRLGGSMISEEDASIACARVKGSEHALCVFDVLASNDKDMAGAY